MAATLLFDGRYTTRLRPAPQGQILLDAAVGKLPADRQGGEALARRVLAANRGRMASRTEILSLSEADVLILYRLLPGDIGVLDLAEAVESFVNAQIDWTQRCQAPPTLSMPDFAQPLLFFP